MLEYSGNLRKFVTQNLRLKMNKIILLKPSLKCLKKIMALPKFLIQKCDKKFSGYMASNNLQIVQI